MGVVDLKTPAFLDEPELVQFADGARRFLAAEATPEAVKRWRADGMVDRDLWRRAGAAGLLLVSADEADGGGGGDFRHEAVLIELLAKLGVEGFGLTLHAAIVAPYIARYGTQEQKARWLPAMAAGERVGAIAMTEPHAGSDLQAIRTTAVLDGDAYVINGAKTFISNGRQADLVIVVAKTDREVKGSQGVSLIVVETGTAGFERGAHLKKMGLDAQDTSELFFQDVRVPKENLLGGEPGRGFYQLMAELPKERLIIALQAVATMERAIEITVDYVKSRQAFGKSLLQFQNTQFKLAEAKTETTIAKVFVYDCLEKLLRGELDAVTASMAKYWTTDLECKIIDECLQFFGGFGYMDEYPISHMYRNARVQRIYGGANEIMKVLIARSL